jgi:hypothetical protein
MYLRIVEHVADLGPRIARHHQPDAVGQEGVLVLQAFHVGFQGLDAAFLQQVAPADDAGHLVGQHAARHLGREEDGLDVAERLLDVAGLETHVGRRQGAADHHQHPREVQEDLEVGRQFDDRADKQQQAQRETDDRRQRHDGTIPKRSVLCRILRQVATLGNRLGLCGR